MKLEMVPSYKRIKEKDYCCVPAVLQMIQARRGWAYDTQDEIGYQLGLIVPPELAHKFTRVRTGSEPIAGFGTQTSLAQFSITGYLKCNRFPLKLSLIQPQTIEELGDHLAASIRADDDVIICCNSRLLFGDGDLEHVLLVQEFDTASGGLLVVDPAATAPDLRETTLDRLFEAIDTHDVSRHIGLWIVSSTTAE